jgi:hypothetical protein
VNVKPIVVWLILTVLLGCITVPTFMLVQSINPDGAVAILVFAFCVEVVVTLAAWLPPLLAWQLSDK